MRKWITSAVITVAVAASVQGATAHAAGLASRFIDCGQTITVPTSFKLGNDLFCGNSDDGITILGGANKVIDLGGHILQGRASKTGIILDASDHNLTIKNGVISGFGFGIDASGSSHDSFTGMTFVNNVSSPLRLVGGTGGTISGNTFTRGGNVQITADQMSITGNRFAGLGLFLIDADGNTASNNDLFGGQIHLDEATDGSQNNVIDTNQVIGASAHGIESHGADSTGNTISNNTVKASGEDGLEVSDSPNLTISGNTIMGNAVNGIEFASGVTNAQISTNTILGNRVDGMYIPASASGTTLVSNTVTNNGANGIETADTAAVLNGNTANFNGFLNGDTSQNNRGISASGTATSSTPNVANGNDVVDASTDQCVGGATSLCSTPASPTNEPDTLTSCGATVGTDLLLDNPLDCAGSALVPGTNGKTVDLGNMAVSSDPGSVVIDLTGGIDSFTLQNGVLLGGATGIDATATNSQFIDLIVAHSGGDAVNLGALSSADQFSGLDIVGAGSAGFHAIDVATTTLDTATIAGSTGSGVLFSGSDPSSSSNVVHASTLIGNGADGASLADSKQNTVSNNQIVGNAHNGVLVTTSTHDSTLNVLRLNTIVGNDEAGVELAGDFVSNGIGLTHNTITKNTVNANVGDGISIETDIDTISNTISSNKVMSNLGGFGGIALHSELTLTKITGNTLNNNAQDGVYFEDPHAGKVINNTANHNGFIADSSATPINEPGDAALGLGFDDTTHGCGNHAKHNDDLENAFPKKVLKPC